MRIERAGGVSYQLTRDGHLDCTAIKEGWFGGEDTTDNELLLHLHAYPAS